MGTYDNVKISANFLPQNIKQYGPLANKKA